MLEILSETTRRTIWIVFLTAASVAFSLVFACATPFAALATMAALNVKRRDAYVLMIAVWLANQLVGYGVLNYPRTLDSFAWGAAIGIAALLATAAAVAIGSRMTGPAVRVAAGFLAAFAVYQGVLYLASLVLGGTDTGFTLHVIWYVAEVNLFALAGLVVLSLGAGAIGLTRPMSHGTAPLQWRNHQS
jgi:hypothetical protein